MLKVLCTAINYNTPLCRAMCAILSYFLVFRLKIFFF